MIGDNILSLFPNIVNDTISKNDNSVTDIQIYPNREIWIKKYGIYQKAGYIDYDFSFIMQELASAVNQEINAKNPMLDIIYMGVRISIQIPPIITSASICIRIPTKKDIPLENYLEEGILSENHYNKIVDDYIPKRKTIVVVGATWSGKTTFMTAIMKKIAEIDPTRYMIIIEDSDELICPLKLHKKFFTAPMLDINMNKLIYIAMRNDPDSISVGELRDFNSLYFLQAGNSGHKGGCTSLHANSAASAPYRIIDLCMENPSLKFIPYRQIEIAVDVFIYIESYLDNGVRKRRVKEVAELIGYNKKDDEFKFNYIER